MNYILLLEQQWVDPFVDLTVIAIFTGLVKANKN